MKIIKQTASLELALNTERSMLMALESAARTCYASERAQTGRPEDAKKLLIKIYRRGHHSVFEHVSITGKFVTCRGITHELVRHRLAAYSQQSTRFCNYSKDRFGNEIEFVLPICLYEDDDNPDLATQSDQYILWAEAMRYAENSYMNLIASGMKAEIARGVLPIDVKTEIVATMNIRQWWHVFGLRRAKAAHPQMVDLMNQWWSILNKEYPFFFGELQEGGKK